MPTIGDESTTKEELLRRAGDWRDHQAWLEIIQRYEPLLRPLCRKSGLSDHETDELLQRVWIDLARRLMSFQYDPTRRFRGWLVTLCQSRIIDVVRERKRANKVSMSDIKQFLSTEEQPTEDEQPAFLDRFKLAHEIQERVRANVSPESWDAFWLTSVENLSLQEAASQLGKSRAAVFQARNRVKKKLLHEGKQRLEGKQNPK
jgi:RNA polymerase sigma factor (sigma-70 family)